MATDEEIHNSLAGQAVSVPALYVVETEHGYARIPGDTALSGSKYLWRLTALDPKEGAIVHLPLLFDFDFAVEVGIVSAEKARELQQQAEPGGSPNA